MTLLQLTIAIATPIVIWLLLREFLEHQRNKRYQTHLNQHIRDILDRNGGKHWEINRHS